MIRALSRPSLNARRRLPVDVVRMPLWLMQRRGVLMFLLGVFS